MPTDPPIRIPFVVLPAADKVHGCIVCHAKMRTGEHGVAVITPGTAHTEHADCTPPPADASATRQMLADITKEIA